MSNIPSETLVVIPACGGSKGLPRKNVLPLAGKPLLAHSVLAARQASMVTRTVVSTDDPEIGAVARDYGAEVVWRPGEISGDSASSESAVLHVLEELHRVENYRPHITVLLQCTAPLTLPRDIDGTIRLVRDADAETALSVAAFHYFLWHEDDSGDAVGINHSKSVRPMGQDREPQFLETGAVYAMRTAGFLEAKHRFFGRTAMYEVPAERVLEIDDPFDLKKAEFFMAEARRVESRSRLPDKIEALVLDFDGVFTDNSVTVSQDGSEAVTCSRADGLGIARLKRTGLPMIVLSTERNEVVLSRCRKVDLECVHGLSNKALALEEWLAQRNLSRDGVIYVGNDVNDLGCMAMVGCPVAVSDAYPEVRAVAKIILNSRGGHGAIREITDLIMARLESDPHSESG